MRYANKKNGYRKGCCFYIGVKKNGAVFLSKKNVQILSRISEKLNLSLEDTLGVLIYKELENLSKNIVESEKGEGTKEQKLRKVFFE